MLRGLLSGTILGTAVSGLALVAASPFVPRVEIGAIMPPATGEMAVPVGSEFNAELPDEPPELPATEGRPVAETPSLAGADGAIESPVVDTSSVAAPDTVAVEGAITAPEAVDGLAVAPSSETVVETGVGAGQPVQPGLETAPETDVVVGEGAPEVPGADVDPGGLASPSILIETPSLPGLGNEEPSLPGVATISPGGDGEGLPNIGSNAATPEVVSVEPALTRFAEPYESVSDVPMISIVLLDQGDLTAAELANFPIPLTVAVDPLSPDAVARTTSLRASGIEVLVLTPLAEGSSPADVEVAFQSFLEEVPEAVGVMDLPSAVLQESRPRASQIVEILKASGHGLLTYNKGLNTALQIAEQENLAAAKVTRVFDEGEGDGPVMARVLDQGAFQSSRDGSAVLVGKLRAETLAVLTQWFTGNRAASVQMVPVSVILSGK